MRRIIYLSLTVLSVVLVPFGLSNTKATSPSVPNLTGTCIWQEFKFPTTSGEGSKPPGTSVGPATVMASIYFNGNGTLTMDYDANINGIYSSTNGVRGTYFVDSTGHGSFSFLSPASGYLRTYDIRVSPNGKTIYTMAQTDGVTIPAQRISTGTCTF